MQERENGGGPGPRVSAAGSRRAGKPRPDAESAKVRACPGALRAQRASRGKLGARVLGRPALFWAPREHGARERGSANALGPRLTGLRAPARPPSWPGLGGGKETGRFFLMEKKNLGSGSRVLPPPPPPPPSPRRPPRPSQQILSEESAPPPGISAAGTLPGRGRAGGGAEESSTCHFLRL